MELYDSEEEQLAALKKWWAENGRSAFAGIIIGVGAIGGWSAWQGYKESQTLEASDLYQQLLDAVEKNQPDSVGELGERITTSYKSTPYAANADLLLAKEKVNTGDLAGAQQTLQGVLKTSANENIKHIARLRLLQLMVSQGENDAALDLISKINVAKSGSFEAAYEELKGDIYVALNRESEARVAYQRAIDLGRNSRFLDLKKDDLVATQPEEPPE